MMEKDLIMKIMENGKRIDQRGFKEIRNVEIENNPISSAEGSAMVKVGNTKVLAGVKMEVGEPYPDTPDEGVLVVNVEFLPLALEEFEPGPPDENAIEVARVVDRIIRESNCIEVEKLKINENLVWCIFIDIDVLDQDGNLIDTAALAAIKALMNTKIPKVDENGNINRDEKGAALPLRYIPCPITLAKIGKFIVVDPCLVEENVLDARVTFGMLENKGIKFCAMQKGGDSGIKVEEFYKMLDLAESLFPKIKEILKKS